MNEENEINIPLLFRCPISLDLFTDPVTLSTGQTYDRPNIEKWLKNGNLTCPVTMQNLHDFSFIPNHTLSQYIHHWLLRGVVVDPFASPQNTHISSSLIILKKTLFSSSSPAAAKLEALKKVRFLSSESDVGISFLLQLDFFPVLVHLVFQSEFKKRDFDLIELALDCILRLCTPHNLTHLNEFFQQDPTFSSLLTLIDQGSSKIKTFLCELIELITNSNSTKELTGLICKSGNVVRILANFLLENKNNILASDSAAAAMAGICKSEEMNKVEAIEEGAVKGLSEYLSSGVRRNAAKALSAIEVLMEEEKGRREGVRVGVVKVLVKWVFRVSAKEEEGSGRAVRALMAICRSFGKARKEAVAAGAVTQLLLLMQSQCSEETKKKVRELLKMLRCSWEEDDDGR